LGPWPKRWVRVITWTQSRPAGARCPIEMSIYRLFWHKQSTREIMEMEDVQHQSSDDGSAELFYISNQNGGETLYMFR
jgi:hypothetical protein